MRILWGDNEDPARLWHLLYEALTETTSVQPIVVVISFTHIYVVPRRH